MCREGERSRRARPCPRSEPGPDLGNAARARQGEPTWRVRPPLAWSPWEREGTAGARHHLSAPVGAGVRSNGVVTSRDRDGTGNLIGRTLTSHEPPVSELTSATLVSIDAWKLPSELHLLYSKWYAPRTRRKLRSFSGR